MAKIVFYLFKADNVETGHYYVENEAITSVQNYEEEFVCVEAESNTISISNNVEKSGGQNEMEQTISDCQPMEIEKTKKPTRKRTRNSHLWKRNVKAAAKNKDEQYISASGIIVSPKVLKPPCTNCRFDCNSKLNLEQRENIKKEFWAMGDKNRQREFIVRHTKVVTPLYSMKTPNSKRIKSNLAYFLNINDSTIQERVCKKMFEATLVISDKMIRNSIVSLTSEGVLKTLSQGKHNNQKKILDELKLDVLKHIDSFPRIPSHYLRAQTQREYIDGSLSVSTMYKLYVINQNQNGKECVLQHVYYDLFNHQRNIGFFQPKKDQCTVCVGWINKTTEEKEVSREEYDAHILAKEQCREEKSKDSSKGREGIIKVCCYDLQAVLQTPCGDVNMFYYKRKLGVYNFTIYEISSRDGYCFVWNEEQANRGAIEMASCLWKYLNEANSIDIPIIFNSDNCAGQNKNKFIATLYSLHVCYNEVKYSINYTQIFVMWSFPK